MMVPGVHVLLTSPFFSLDMMTPAIFSPVAAFISPAQRDASEIKKRGWEAIRVKARCEFQAWLRVFLLLPAWCPAGCSHQEQPVLMELGHLWSAPACFQGMFPLPFPWGCRSLPDSVFSTRNVFFPFIFSVALGDASLLPFLAVFLPFCLSFPPKEAQNSLPCVCREMLLIDYCHSFSSSFSRREFVFFI